MDIVTNAAIHSTDASEWRIKQVLHRQEKSIPERTMTDGGAEACLICEGK